MFFSIFFSWIVKNQTKFVGFVFIFVMFFLGNYTIIAKKSTDIKLEYHIPVLFLNSDAILVGTPVFTYGVRIGYVTALNIVELENKNNVISIMDKSDSVNSKSYGLGVVAILSVSENLLFYHNYRIVTQSFTTFGGKKIELYTGNSANWKLKPLSGNPHIFQTSIDQSKPIPALSLTPKEIIDFKKRSVLPKRNILLSGSNYDNPVYLISKVINENRANLRTVFSNLKEISYRMVENSNTVGALINSSELSDDVNDLLVKGIYTLNEAHDGLESLRESDIVVGFISNLFRFSSIFILTNGFSQSFKQGSISRGGWAPEIFLLPQLSNYRFLYRKTSQN